MRRTYLADREDKALRTAQQVQENVRNELRDQIVRNRELNKKLCSVQANAKETQAALSSSINSLESHLKKLNEKYVNQKRELETYIEQHKNGQNDVTDLRNDLKHS